ncbi:hypothetical protein L249_7369, partial [Ophiocordyceps polyrhachis-furcata BCC 54312]
RLLARLSSLLISSLAGALDTLTHIQGTRPEGLGGSRDAGPAVAGPRPPYVIEAEAATPYSGYGRTGRTGLRKFPPKAYTRK